MIDHSFVHRRRDHVDTERDLSATPTGPLQRSVSHSIKSQIALAAPPLLDRATYGALIDLATLFYARGHRTITIDLAATHHIDQAGLYALYCVHLIFQGEHVPDIEDGISALRYVTDRVRLDGHQGVIFTNVAPHLATLLDRAGFRRQPTSHEA